MCQDWRYVGAFASVSHVRACGLLRLVQEQARHQAFPQDTASTDPLHRAGGTLDLVLCGRDRARRTGSLNLSPGKLAACCRRLGSLPRVRDDCATIIARPEYDVRYLMG